MKALCVGCPARLRWIAREAERLWSEALEVIEIARGRLTFNDALLVVLQRGRLDRRRRVL
jgi:hypothetical protein